jgi:hypothetical protein
MLRRLCFVLIPSADENWKLWAQCSQVFVKLMFSIFSISVLNDNNYPCWVFCFVFWLGLRPLYIFSWFVVCFNKTLSQQGFPLLFSVKKQLLIVRNRFACLQDFQRRQGKLVHAEDGRPNIQSSIVNWMIKCITTVQHILNE